MDGLKLKSVAQFAVPYLQILGPDGVLTQSLPEPFRCNSKIIIPLYRGMVLARVLDERSIKLKFTGRLGTYPSSRGQEAIGVAAAAAMLDNDCLCPSYRDAAAQLWRGVEPRTVLLFWGGHPLGNVFAHGPSVNDLPNTVPVSSQCYLAAGMAHAFKMRGESRAALCILGDGATSNAAFTGSLNWAGVHKLPVVYLINNNQWAISCPLSEQTAAKTLAQKAFAAGVPGMQIDGNDVFAVYAAVNHALTSAREGGGPFVIEALSYRLGDHTTVDDATRYRADDEVAEAAQKEPIARLRTYLMQKGLWNDEQEAALTEELTALVQSEVDAYEATPPAGVETLFDHVQKTVAPYLAAELEEAECFVGDGS